MPTDAQRRQQIHYVNYVCHALGIEEPRISLIHCAEKVSAKTFPYTVDYLEIIAEAQTGAFGRCIIDGPLDLKTSLDSVSLREKGIHSVIDGQADALIFPDIVALGVDLDFLFTAHGSEHIHGQSRQLVLAWIHEDRSEET